MTAAQHLVLANASLVLLTLIVAMRMLYVRIREMQRRGIPPQAVATPAQRATRLEDSRASDNYNHLYELPVLFYALSATALALDHIPAWLPILAWVFVLLRVLHSAIQCSYNKVIHRFPVFVLGLLLVMGMWLAYTLSYVQG